MSASLCAAQTPLAYTRVVFHTRPEGARVFFSATEIGLSGRPIAITGGKSPGQWSEAPSYQVAFVKEGFANATLTLQRAQLFGANPVELQSVALVPNGLRGWATLYPMVFLGSTLAILGAAVLGGRAVLGRRGPGGDPLIGKKIGQYTLVQALGDRVYRGESSDEYSRSVTVRLLDSPPDPKVRALNHPRLARVLAVHEQPGMVGLVTELVRGKNLRARLAEGKPTLAETIACFSQLAEGVGSAHQQGFVFNNLTPERIVLTPTGVKVVDLGIGSAGSYAAPEGPGTAAGDQYSLGLILAEMLPETVPDAIRRTAARMTAQNPDERFPDLARAALNLTVTEGV